MKFKIYPTNNSLSYKVLSYLNKKLFKCGVPQHVCGYFWLSVFYGAAVVFITLNTLVFVEVLSSIIFGSYLEFVTYFHTGLVITGVIAALVFAFIFWIGLHIVACVGFYLLAVYILKRKEVDRRNLKSFATTLVEQHRFIVGDCVEFLMDIKLPKIKLPKCKKLNFNGEEE